MAILNVNDSEMIGLTAKLERLNKSAFPNAVRNTLNKAGFETKKQIPKSAEKVFTTRDKTFFKRFSIVNKAKGFDVNKMIATVGINANLNHELAENLEAQEFGGLVRAKKLIPHDKARVSGSQSKRIAAQNKMPKVQIHNATTAFKAHKGTRKSKFIAAVMSTAKSGKKHMMLKTGTIGMVYEVTSINKGREKVSFKIKKLYAVRDKKNHQVRGRHFMLDAATVASKDMEKYYIENAQYQFDKELKKK
jgi:hypothetical protein